MTCSGTSVRRGWQIMFLKTNLKLILTLAISTRKCSTPSTQRSLPGIQTESFLSEQWGFCRREWRQKIADELLQLIDTRSTLITVMILTSVIKQKTLQQSLRCKAQCLAWKVLKWQIGALIGSPRVLISGLQNQTSIFRAISATTSLTQVTSKISTPMIKQNRNTCLVWRKCSEKVTWLTVRPRSWTSTSRCCTLQQVSSCPRTCCLNLQTKVKLSLPGST